MPSHADRLDDILTQMDKASASFVGMSAQITYTKVTVVVDDKQVKTGGIYLAKDKKNNYKIKIEFRSPDNETVVYKDGVADVYNPQTNHHDRYDVREHKEEMDQFLQLGFGGGGHTMQSGYDITVAGEARIGSDNTVKLDLTPKKPSTGLQKVELWISQSTWLPVQQKFIQKSKDYTLIEYSAIKQGPQDNKSFELKTKR